jgi:hypothetical protein
MLDLHLSTLVALAALTLAACGDNRSCKDACAKLDSCSLADSSFTCSDSCISPAATCAACINGTACSDILSKCGAAGSNLACGTSDIRPK